MTSRPPRPVRSSSISLQLSGWLFADLLLGAMIIFLAAIPGVPKEALVPLTPTPPPATATSTPIPPTPTPIPCDRAIDREAFPIHLTGVDSTGRIRGGSPLDEVKRQLDDGIGNRPGRRWPNPLQAGLVYTYGHTYALEGRSDPFGNALALGVNRALEADKLFVDAVLQDGHHNGLSPGQVYMDIFLFICR